MCIFQRYATNLLKFLPLKESHVHVVRGTCPPIADDICCMLHVSIASWCRCHLYWAEEKLDEVELWVIMRLPQCMLC